MQFPIVSRYFSRRANSRLLAAAVFCALTASTALAQNADAADDGNRKRRGGTTEDANGRRAFNPEDMQARLLSSLRERLEVPDDEEWKLISERITKVNELRRSTGGAGAGAMAFGGRGPQTGGGGGDNGRGSRGGRGGGGSAEITALQTAVRDKLPDAEIKSRLDRVREIRKDSEAKLTKAQEDLRALLTVRQEAVAVMFGLLP